MRAIRRDAQPRRKRERTRVASVLLAPGIAEARGQASVTYVGGAGDDPYLDSYREQLAEERERGDGRHRTPGVDEQGRTRSDRRAWMSVLRGFTVAAALLRAGDAAAVTLVEPTTTTSGMPLSSPGNALWACVFTAGPSPTTFWLRPSSPAGGGSHTLPEPVQTADLPWAYTARCLNASGWGPEITGTLDLRLTTP